MKTPVEGVLQNPVSVANITLSMYLNNATLSQQSTRWPLSFQRLAGLSMSFHQNFLVSTNRDDNLILAR